MNRDGVLLVGHGTVHDLDDIPAFLTRIRRGRPPSEALIGEVTRRYREVGGSPFLEVSVAQGRALSERLGLPVIVAMRMWEPFIEEGLREAVDRGFERLCVLPLAPFSVHIYADAVATCLGELDVQPASRPTLVRVAPWGRHPALVDAHVTAVRDALRGLSVDETRVVLTAHSLPMVAIERGDPYQAQFEAMANDIVARLPGGGTIAYQSQGADGGRWLGPDIRETLETARADGVKTVVMAPVGFLADHVETLYDLDVEARGWATELSLGFRRVPALGLSEGLIVAMSDAARRALSAGEEEET